MANVSRLAAFSRLVYNCIMNNQDIVIALDGVARAIGQPAKVTTYRYDNGTATRSTNATGLRTDIPGLTIQYTAPDYPVSLFIFSSILLSNSVVATQRHAIGVNFSPVGYESYITTTGYLMHHAWAVHNLEPGETATLTGLYYSGSGTLQATNTTSDAYTDRYNQYLVAELRRGNV